MRINTNKILNAKKNKSSIILEDFNFLKKNYTIPNSIQFMNKFRKQPNDVILENLKCLYGIPNSGTSFLNHFISVNDLNSDILEVQKENLNSFINTLERNNYSNNDHLKELNDSVNLMESLIQKRSSSKYLKNQVLIELNIKRLHKYFTLESYLANNMDIIINNINYEPGSSIDLYHKLVQDITYSDVPDKVSNFPDLLIKNTHLLISLNGFNGYDYTYIMNLPFTLAEKLIEYKVGFTEIRSYISIIDSQIELLSNELDVAPEDKKEVYTVYIAKLKKSKEILCNYKDKLKETVAENIAEMQPDIKLYEDAVIEDITADLDAIIANIVFDEDDDEDIFEDTLEQLTRVYLTLEAIEKDDDVDINIDIENKNINDNRSGLFAREVNKAVDNFKDLDQAKRFDELRSSQKRKRFFKYIGGAIAGIAGGYLIGVGIGKAAFVVSPVLATIGFLTAIAINKKLARNERQQILEEMELELKIVKEKISDLHGDGDKERKYQLLRIQYKLEKDIEKIRFHLK